MSNKILSNKVNSAIKRAALLGALVTLSACNVSLPDVSEQELMPKLLSTRIYAADNSAIVTLRGPGNEARDLVDLNDVPKHVQDAVTAVEDARFYSHRGVDLRGVVRAVYKNANSGRVTQGGSTITQQLVRNAIGSVGRQRTAQRKIKEAVYAYSVENHFSKRRILELYLNTVYFGRGAYGIEAASSAYFGKHVKDLSIEEGAFLAGIIKAPERYDPAKNQQAAIDRRNTVLERMEKEKLATTQVIQKAKAAPIGLPPAVANQKRYGAPYYVDMVREMVIDRQGSFRKAFGTDFTDFGKTPKERESKLHGGGLRIYTSLDPKLQQAAEESVDKVLGGPNLRPSSSIVAIDPKNGHVKALVGGKDYFVGEDKDPCVVVGRIDAAGKKRSCGQVNLALGSLGGGSGRQAGSSFKPFALVAALEKGITLEKRYRAASQMTITLPKNCDRRPWKVSNYEDSAFGSVDLLEGTYRSINVVYAQLAGDIGQGNHCTGAKATMDVAARMGIFSKLQAVPSGVLGVNPVGPLEMASAYATLANNGAHVKPVVITKITDPKGNILWRPPAEKEQALRPAIAYLATKALQEVINKGTASAHGKIGRPAAGKTGTSQEWRDAWFVGYTPDLVAAVWVGWPDSEIEMKSTCGGERTKYEVRKVKEGATSRSIVLAPQCRAAGVRVTGGLWPTNIWQLFMLKALDGVPASEFPAPKFGFVKTKVDISRGCLPNPYTPPDLIREATFLEGAEPTDICKEPTSPVINKVPNVTGFPRAEAESLITKAGFKPKVAEEAGPYPPGTVVRQTPAADAEAVRGSEVQIWVTPGAPTGASAAPGIQVPDVRGKDVAEARRIIQEAKLGVNIVYQQESCKTDSSKCIVVDQDPKPRVLATAGQPVSLFVNLLPGKKG